MSYRCNACGYRSAKWMGFCPQCRSTDSLSEHHDRLVSPVTPPSSLAEVATDVKARMKTNIQELDRVLGGGLVAGSVILVGGEPGVGKSTLLLQVAHQVVQGGGRVLLATAEESAQQVAMRAERLGVDSADLLLSTENDIDSILANAAAIGPDLLIVDSVQTVVASDIANGAGTVGQVRECAARTIRFSKESGVATVLVGHVTKDGSIAGPKLLEHMVDVVLYLEGESEQGLRALRSLKNRFGATNGVGLFEMRTTGLEEVADPSAALLAGRSKVVPGTIIYPAVQGRRPLLVEVQALVSPAPNAPQPRRSVRGIETARVHQLLAVLERHAGLSFGGSEVYVGVVGGLRIVEPAADLPVALALVSSKLDIPLDGVAAWGEIGLTGEVRQVAHETHRREETHRLGIPRAVGPNDCSTVAEAIEWAGMSAPSGSV